MSLTEEMGAVGLLEMGEDKGGNNTSRLPEIILEKKTEKRSMDARLKIQMDQQKMHSRQRKEMEKKIEEMREQLAKEQNSDAKKLQKDLEADKEHFQNMAASIAYDSQEGKRKLADFYDGCKTAILEDFIPNKLFGQIDLGAIRTAYEEKYGIKPDHRPSSKNIEAKEAYKTCKQLQNELCGTYERGGPLWEWQPKRRKTQDGEWETYFDKEDKVYIDIANEWGATLADLVYEERVLIHDHDIPYVSRKPWNDEEKRKLTPAEIVEILTDKIFKLSSKKRKVA
ncbi:hypothetical protein CYMTET_5339 [Cymbomonas tetramitiformis]|uniref:Factor of DNA methylation 1-5/IDN2 domain-containing protein n=1 Tax=Cymbomonas tetramitiformis TaxID=36881 RepID=A0AAE0LJG9_9CHLO|nr:hypothetical protein CYMTET_5339 [Cymbomonas tetramitiformis]